MLETPKDIIATTQSETIIVKCLKRLYIDLQLIMFYGSYIVNHKTTQEAVKWAISSKACSRVVEFAEFVKKKKILKNLGFIIAGGRHIVKTPAMNASENGMMNTKAKTLKPIERNAENRREDIGLTIKISSIQEEGIMQPVIGKGIETLYTKHTATSVPAAENQIQNSLRLTTLTTMVISNVNIVMQVVQNSTERLLKPIFQIPTRYFVIIAILVERGMEAYALIKNVQRLLRKQVHPSGWKRLQPLRGYDIVPSAWKHAAV